MGGGVVGASSLGDSRGARSAWLAPVLMAYYLCCWPGDAKSETSSERQGSRRGTFGHDSGSYRRSNDFFSRRMGSSAVSLHLPSTSGHKKEPLSAHRSHEEIGRRKSNHESHEESTRYHSAPSVIDEVLHRRDWERSTRDLFIPLKPEVELLSASSGSPEAPCAEPESSSIEDHKTDEQIVGRICKKHHTNIKSSKAKKEREADDDKDSDATEVSNFYIGDNECSTSSISSSPRREDVGRLTKSIYKAKDAKQSFNESIRSKDRPRQTLVPLEEHQPRMFDFSLDEVIDQLESLDRSGAMHHTIESRISLSKPPFPPPSVEAVGYDGGACYLAERGTVASLRARGAGAGDGGALRARHASDGDILGPPPPQRPESGAFSESDLDFELEAVEEAPPSYHELHELHHEIQHEIHREIHHFAAADRKETAI